jgi:hypothetical protein
MRSCDFRKFKNCRQDSFRGGCKVSVSAMFVMLLPFCTGLALTASISPPDITLNIPASFGTSVTVKSYRKGDDILNSPPFHLITAASMTQYQGWYEPRPADPSHNYAWSVRVYAALRKKVIAAYETAHDGFEADLNEAKQFFGWDHIATFDTFARFSRKHFRWGDAVSFLHSEYQDGPDGGAKYVPDNDHLTYEVWGVTREQQCTVVASVHVRHPKLATWPNGRVAKSIDALKQDRDYKLIETCSPEKFEPSLAAFDQLVDSLKLQ